MSWESAAGLAACGLTLYRVIYKYYNDFHPRKRVLITGTYSPQCGIHLYSYCLSGGSTSVGQMAIQITKLSSGYVVASCSKASEAGV